MAVDRRIDGVEVAGGEVIEPGPIILKKLGLFSIVLC